MDSVRLVRAGWPISITVEIAEYLRFGLVAPGQITQVLYNILLNARQAMPGGGIIDVRAENAVRQDGPEAEDRIRITIRDYGCGIPDEVRPRIFDPYFTTKPGGSGLGLATAYAIVAKHGGNVMVDSRPGEGSVFVVDLPASHDVPAAQAPLEPEMEAETQAGAGRVLVMDDEEALRNLLKTVLGGMGYEVETAQDGAEAIALYEEAKEAGRGFDAVLLDLTVSGGMGGIEAAAKLKELDPGAKLIVSSGYSVAPVMSEYARYGFAAVIPKPWTINEVGEVIGRVIAGAPERKGEGLHG